MSLLDPTKKMSKSDPAPKSRILITDSNKDIAQKINGAVTDSLGPVTYDPVLRPGVANLLRILSALDPEHRTAAQLAEAMAGEGMAELKRAVSTAICKDLDGVRDKYLDFLSRPNYLQEVEANGMRKAIISSGKTMQEVKEVVGLGKLL
jgi:tryptophanyl-tRNA synthetase